MLPKPHRLQQLLLLLLLPLRQFVGFPRKSNPSVEFLGRTVNNADPSGWTLSPESPSDRANNDRIKTTTVHPITTAATTRAAATLSTRTPSRSFGGTRTRPDRTGRPSWTSCFSTTGTKRPGGNASAYRGLSGTNSTRNTSTIWPSTLPLSRTTRNNKQHE